MIKKRILTNTYFFNNINLTKYNSLENLKSLGYPQDFLNRLDYLIIKNSFPITFPFHNIKLLKKNFLDIGCGIGIDGFYALNYGAKNVIGIDLSFSLIKRSLTQFKIVADANILPFKTKEYFDIILLNGSFNQIKFKKKLLKYLNKIVSKNGIIVICDLLWIGEIKEFFLYKNSEEAWLFNIGGSLTEESIWNIVSETSFIIQKFEKFEKEYPIQKFRLILKKS